MEPGSVKRKQKVQKKKTKKQWAYMFRRNQEIGVETKRKERKVTE